MRKKLFQWLLLLCGALIALGAVGHSLRGIRQIRGALILADLPTAISDLIVVVWHFAGGCMALFGGLVLWQVIRLRRGLKLQTSVVLGVALFYIVFGSLAVLSSGSIFFFAFVGLGAGLLLSLWGLRRSV